MVDVEKGVITPQVPMDSFVTRLKFTESGEALMVYTPSIDTVNGLSAAPPRILLLDTSDLSPHWSVELEDVHDGIFPKDENVTLATLYEPGQALHISPGLTFAPNQDILYVVHADSEQLTTVNFTTQKINTVEIQTKLTWFERLLSLTAGVASAKIVDGTNKQAAISSDGQFLYVVGMDRVSFQDKQGNLQLEQTPLGLEIIQTSDGSRVQRFDTDATDLSISPDGRFLYLRNWSESTPWTEVFDTSSQQVVAHKAEVFAMPAFLMNGEFLLVSNYSTSEKSHHMSVLEPDRLNLLAEWTVNDDVYFYWLTLLEW
jgi:6-phosphogluconolactonase (cycloisomerase 2 family)